MLPALDVETVGQFCQQRVPARARHQVRLELVESRDGVTIVERRAPWHEDAGPEWTSRGIARLRYATKNREWTLYWRDRNQRWHHYDLIDPTPNILALLDEVDRDPTCIFWG